MKKSIEEVTQYVIRNPAYKEKDLSESLDVYGPELIKSIMVEIKNGKPIYNSRHFNKIVYYFLKMYKNDKDAKMIIDSDIAELESNLPKEVLYGPQLSDEEVFGREAEITEQVILKDIGKMRKKLDKYLKIEDKVEYELNDISECLKNMLKEGKEIDDKAKDKLLKKVRKIKSNLMTILDSNKS